MPDFTIVPVKEAQFRTIPGRQGKYLNEYAEYIQQLPTGQAGKLHTLEQENPLTIRRRLMQAAQALDTQLTIKRSGQDVYFWKESGEAEQPRSNRRYTKRSRRGRAGDLIVPNQSFSVPEEGEQGVPKEESPELSQLAAEAERRVEES
jgi:hypothetical protein